MKTVSKKGFLDEDEIKICMDKVKSVIRRMVTHEIDVEDLAQEVFVKALKNINLFQEKSQIYTWLYKIAVNTTYTFLSKNKNKRVQTYWQLPDKVDFSLSALDKIIHEEELEMGVGQILHSLSPKLKSVMILTVLYEMDTAEVAKMEGCSEATIYWRIHQAKKKLASA